MKRTLLRIVLILVFFAVSLGVLYWVGDAINSDAQIYHMMWGLTLPADVREEYSLATPASFHGDGIRYTVYACGELPSASDAAFSSSPDGELEERVLDLLKTLQVPDKHKPNFYPSYEWGVLQKGENQLYLIYNPVLEQLYCVQYTQ